MSSNILKLVVIQYLVGTADHGVTSLDATAPYLHIFSGASLVQKRSTIEKLSKEVFDEDDEDDLVNATADGGHEQKVEQVSSKKDDLVNATADGGHERKDEQVKQLKGQNATKGTDPATIAGAGSNESRKAAELLGDNVDERRSSIDTIRGIEQMNVAIHGDDGLTVSMVGDLSDPDPGHSGAHNNSNSSEYTARSKVSSWLLVVQDRCSKAIHDVGSRLVSSFVANHWVSDSTGSDAEGSIVLICFGMMLATILFASLMCVHQMTNRQPVVEDIEDSSAAWYHKLDDSSPFSKRNRQPWYFKCLGFAWTSRFSVKPMPPYSMVRRG